jgi:hypothetical protein
MPNYSPGSYDNYERKRLQIARGGMATAMGPMNSLLGRAPSSGAGMSPFAGGMGGRLAGQVGTISPPALPNGMRWGGAGSPQGHYVPRQVAGQGMPLAPRSSSPPGPGSTFFPGQRMPSLGGMVAGLAPQIDRRMGAGLPIASAGPSALAMQIANYFNPQSPQAPQGHNVPRQVGGSPPINWNLGFGRGGNLDVGAPQGSLNSLLPQGQRQPIEPHPAAQYAQGLRQARGTPGQGLMDNYAAQQNYAQTGYMPNMTVGGAWGQKPAALSLGEKLRYGTPAEQAEAGGVVTDRLIANKDGRHFGGAVPVTDSMGRVHFVDPGQPGAASGMSPNQAALAQIAKNPRLGLTASGQGLVGQPEALSPDREAQLAANRAAYQERRGLALESRAANVQEKAQIRSQDRYNRIADRKAGPDYMDQLAQLATRNPGMAMQLARMNQEGALTAAQMNNALILADKQGQSRADVARIEAGAGADRNKAAFVAALANADIPQEEWPAAMAAAGFGDRGMQLDQQSPQADPNRTRMGGLATNRDTEELNKLRGNPSDVAAYMQKKMRLSGPALNKAINDFYAGNNWSGARTRTGDDPTGWSGWFGKDWGKFVDPNGNQQSGWLRWIMDEANSRAPGQASPY